MEMRKSLPTWGFPILTPLNLLRNGVGNGDKIFTGVGNAIGLLTPTPTSTPPHPIVISK